MRADLDLAGLDPRFRLDAFVSRGAWGSLYAGRDLATGAAVAVKRLHPHLCEPTMIARFEREASLLAELDSPHVVRHVAHARDAGDRPYLVLEWLDGEDLARWKKARRPGPRRVVEVVRQAALGLAVLHGAGIVHGDVKPSSFFFVETPAGPGVKLIDLGIARATRAPAPTATGFTLGTPAYLSPEQAGGDRLPEATSDLFSLGVVLFELFSGVKPYRGDDMVSLAMKIVLQDPPRLRDELPAAPPAVDDVVARAMGKAPGDRFPSALAFAEALGRLDLGDDAPEPAPDSIEVASPHVVRGGGGPGSGMPSSWTLGPSADRRVITAIFARFDGAPEPAPAIEGFREAAERHGGVFHHVLGPQRVAVFGGGHDEGGSPPAVTVGGAETPPNPPVTVGGAETPPNPPVTVGGAETPPNPLVTVGGAETPPNPPVTVGGAETPPNPPVTVGGAETPPNPLVTVGGAETPPNPPVTVGGAETPPNPLVTVGGAETPPNPPGRGRGDEALRAARVALAVAAIPGVRLSIVTGLPVSAEGSLSAGLIERGLAEVRRCHGDVRVDETTARLLEGRIGVEGIQGGRVLPVISPPPDAFGPRLLGRASPLLGREREVAALFALLEVCVAEPAVRAVLITGPPGAGKSRLLYELTRRAEASATPPRVLVGRGDVPGAPFSMIGSALRGLAGERAGWHAWLGSERARHPVILILEDLHRGDLPSVSFVDAALRRAEGQALLVVVAARPEVHERFPGLFAGRGLEERCLGALSRKASERLVRKALGPDVDDGLVRRMVDRAAGNALHLEELVRGVAEGLADALPETLAGVVQARLDALGGEPRRLLLAAGVLGRTFWPGAVSALMGESSVERTREILAGLEAAELVVRRRESRIPGEIEYDFAHAVVHDAAYAALIPEDRARGHRLAGAWLSARGGADDAVLAEHFARGGDLDEARRHELRAAEQGREGEPDPPPNGSDEVARP